MKNRGEQRSMLQVLIELREYDPQFKRESGLVELGYRQIKLRDIRALRAAAGILQ